MRIHGPLLSLASCIVAAFAAGCPAVLEARGCASNNECDSGEACNTGSGLCEASVTAACTATARVENAGGQEASVPVLIELPRLDGLRDDATNLRFSIDGGPALPYAVDAVTATSVTTWVRLAPLPAGVTTVAVSSCDDVAQPVNPSVVFDFIASSVTAAEAKWAFGCTGFEATAETCQAAFPDAAAAKARVSLVNDASCGVAPFNGLQSTLSLPIVPPAGTYAIDVDVGLRALHIGTEGATRVGPILKMTGTGAHVLRDFTVDPIAPGATVVTEPAPNTFTDVVLGAADVRIELSSSVGDCANMTWTLDNLRVRRQAAGAITVSVER